MITEMLQEISQLPGCLVTPPREHLHFNLTEGFPPDLAEFYRRCDGVDLFVDQSFGFRLVEAGGLQPANRAVFGEDFYLANRDELNADLTSSWYVIAVGVGPEERISIDLGNERRGYCYDSFDETHGTPDCAIVARSFTELLRRLIDAQGVVLYWKQPGAPDYGFAR
jgi:hypothetical protein